MFRGKTAGLVVIGLLVVVMIAAVIAYLAGFEMPGDNGRHSDAGPRIVALLALLVVIGARCSPRRARCLRCCAAC